MLPFYIECVMWGYAIVMFYLSAAIYIALKIIFWLVQNSWKPPKFLALLLFIHWLSLYLNVFPHNIMLSNIHVQDSSVIASRIITSKHCKGGPCWNNCVMTVSMQYLVSFWILMISWYCWCKMQAHPYFFPIRNAESSRTRNQ